jgi:hypothetical protein
MATFTRVRLVIWLLLATLVVQQIASYTKILTLVSSGESQDVEWRVLAVAPGVLLSLMIAPRRARDLTLSWLSGAVIVAAISGATIGIVSGNLLRYVAADGFRFAMPWIAFLVGSMALLSLPQEHRQRECGRALLFVLGLSVFDAVYTIVVGAAFPGHRISTDLHLFGIGWALLAASGNRASRALILGVCLAAVVFSGKRGNLVALGGGLALTCVVGLMRPGFFRRVANGALPVVILSTFAVAAALWFSDFAVVRVARDELSSRHFDLAQNLMDIAVGGAEDDSYEGRMRELRNVTSHLSEYPQYVLLGAGFGAVTPMREDSGVPCLIPGMMHHVHIGWVAYLLRNGLLGIALYFLFFWVVGVRLLRNSQQTPYCYGSLFLLSASLVLSLKSNILLEGIDLSLVAAFGLAATPLLDDRRVANWAQGPRSAFPANRA